MRILPCLLLAFCSACGAKPVAAGKATPTFEAPHQVEIQAQMVFPQATVANLADEILFYPTVKECLRQDLKAHPEVNWRVVFSAVLNAQGRLEELRFATASADVERCLSKALPQVPGPNGSPTVFILTFQRARPGMATGKTLLIDLGQDKKLQ